MSRQPVVIGCYDQVRNIAGMYSDSAEKHLTLDEPRTIREYQRENANVQVLISKS